MADNADFWLEQMMRVAENPAFRDKVHECEDALHSLVDHLVSVATGSDPEKGQSIFNRAFHNAQVTGHSSLARDIDQIAQHKGYQSPAAITLELQG